jgi:hypothetical protein
MDLNHLNNFQLFFTIYIICSYESLNGLQIRTFTSVNIPTWNNRRNCIKNKTHYGIEPFHNIKLWIPLILLLWVFKNQLKISFVHNKTSLFIIYFKIKIAAGDFNPTGRYGQLINFDCSIIRSQPWLLRLPILMAKLIRYWTVSHCSSISTNHLNL